MIIKFILVAFLALPIVAQTGDENKENGVRRTRYRHPSTSRPGTNANNENGAAASATSPVLVDSPFAYSGQRYRAPEEASDQSDTEDNQPGSEEITTLTQRALERLGQIITRYGVLVWRRAVVTPTAEDPQLENSNVEETQQLTAESDMDQDSEECAARLLDSPLNNPDAPRQADNNSQGFDLNELFEGLAGSSCPTMEI